jgi:hypothetical protein
MNGFIGSLRSESANDLIGATGHGIKDAWIVDKIQGTVLL